jgi:hypothetical protein
MKDRKTVETEDAITVENKLSPGDILADFVIVLLVIALTISLTYFFTSRASAKPWPLDMKRDARVQLYVPATVDRGDLVTMVVKVANMRPDSLNGKKNQVAVFITERPPDGYRLGYLVDALTSTPAINGWCDGFPCWKVGSIKSSGTVTYSALVRLDSHPRNTKKVCWTAYVASIPRNDLQDKWGYGMMYIDLIQQFGQSAYIIHSTVCSGLKS